MSQPAELPGKTDIVKRRFRNFLLRRTPFYRAYPYDLAVDMGSANHRGVVSLSHKFFFNRVPKAANSSIVAALASGGCGDSKNMDVLKDDMTKPSQLSMAQVEDFKEFYKFTVVRNPYSRTLSAYLDLIVSRGYYKELCLTSFQEFLEFLDGKGLHKNIHWAPQTSFLLLPVDTFNLIGRFEALDVAVEEIAKRTGIPIDMARSAYRPHATDAKAKMAEYYSDDAIATVRRLYSEDFAKLGYPIDFPE